MAFVLFLTLKPNPNPNQPLHDHHLGYITKNGKKRGKKGPYSWAFFFPPFFFCNFVILKWPISPQKFKIRQIYNGKIEILPTKQF
jgi:hypothetical protein